MSDLTEEVRCNLDWKEDSPKLIFTFSPTVHPETVIELSRLIEKTLEKALSCQTCSNTSTCDHKIN